VEHPGTALDYLLATYVRAPEILSTCIDLLLNAGGKSKYQDPAVMAVIRNRLNDLAKLLDSDPSLIHRHFPALDIGTTAARLLTLRGATLLHVAAEFGNLEAVRLLLDRGAGVNAKATVDIDGIGGQTAIFHAATQGGDCGFSIVKFLVDQGADLSVHAKLPGHYEKPGEIVECTPLGYALLFPGNHGPTSTFLRERAGNE
jgi:ankyrin repeat protein